MSLFIPADFSDINWMFFFLFSSDGGEEEEEAGRGPNRLLDAAKRRDQSRHQETGREVPQEEGRRHGNDAERFICHMSVLMWETCW